MAPHVEHLPIHLPDEHTIVFNAELPMEEILQQAEGKVTKLMAYFNLCRDYPELTSTITYQDIPKHFTWQAKKSLITGDLVRKEMLSVEFITFILMLENFFI